MERESYLILKNGTVEKTPWCDYTNPEYPIVINSEALRVYAPSNTSLRSVFSALSSKLGKDMDFEYIFEVLAETGVYGDKNAMYSKLVGVV